MIRAVYLLLSQWWGDEPLPGTSDPTWPRARLMSTRTWSRYFIVGNLIRAGTIAPIYGFTLANRQLLGSIILSYPIGIHILLTLIEAYKQRQIAILLRTAEDLPYKPQPKYEDLSVVTRGAFGLLPFESERLYRSLGMEFFRALVTWYASQAMGDHSQVRFMDGRGRRAAVDFAMEASRAESIHAKGAAINTVVLLLIMHRAPIGFIVWLAAWVFAEWWLVLLQRYMRVRVFVAISKRLGKAS